MTDERFSLLVRVMGTLSFSGVRDERIPEGVPRNAGDTPGVPRLGVPALRTRDCHHAFTSQSELTPFMPPKSSGFRAGWSR